MPHRQHREFRVRLAPGGGGATRVSALRVQNCDGGLDQALIKDLFGAGAAQPEFLPYFVTGEEVASIEQGHAACESVVGVAALATVLLATPAGHVVLVILVAIR